jgi:hypothetical protein
MQRSQQGSQRAQCCVHEGRLGSVAKHEREHALGAQLGKNAPAHQRSSTSPA